MSLRDRFAEWWRHSVSLRWIDTGDQWQEYETVWRTEHAANVHIYRKKVQRHPETGEERVSKLKIVGVTEPIEKFDADGSLYSNIPPSADTEAVIGVKGDDT